MAETKIVQNAESKNLEAHLGENSMRLYISGAITGLEYEKAESAFMWAEMLIEKAGHTPLNPMTLVDQAEGRSYNEYLADALRVMLTEAEGVYFLSNWQDSFGAKIEHHLAIRCGMPIFYAASELPIGSDWPERTDA